MNATPDRLGGLSEDQHVYPRAMLRHMLTLKQDNGLPVVWPETLLRQFVEDIGTDSRTYSGDPTDVEAWAMEAGGGMGSEPHRLACHIDLAYRIMVGAMPVSYQPDWLCVAPSPRLGSGRFPAWTQSGRKVV